MLGSVGAAARSPPFLAVLQSNGAGATADRMLLTTGILVALAVGWLAVRRLGNLARRRYDERTVETVELSVVTLLVGAAAAGITAVWDAATRIQNRILAVAQDELLGVRLVVSLLFLAVAYGLVRVAGRLVMKSTAFDVVTDHRREVAYHVVQVAVYGVAILLVLGVWRVDLGNLLVGAGFLGIVLGLAARQTLGAVLAGFVLLFARPFEVGEWVEIGDHEGIVVDVSIFNTRLKTLDDEHVLIPNDRITGREVINRSREGRLRVTVEVGVDYDADVDRAAEVAETAMADVDLVLDAPRPHVVGKGFADSAVLVELRFWIDDPSARRKWRAQTRVLQAVKRAFEREGIEIPFPQRTLGTRGEGVPLGRVPTDDRGRDPGERRSEAADLVEDPGDSSGGDAG